VEFLEFQPPPVKRSGNDPSSRGSQINRQGH
jgi:hypothetical protein